MIVMCHLGYNLQSKDLAKGKVGVSLVFTNCETIRIFRNYPKHSIK